MGSDPGNGLWRKGPANFWSKDVSSDAVLLCGVGGDSSIAAAGAHSLNGFDLLVSIDIGRIEQLQIFHRSFIV